MGLIKEPLNIDFYFDGKQMSEEDPKRVSEFIKKQKELEKRRLSKRNKQHSKRGNVNETLV